jgi:hypothetical protein
MLGAFAEDVLITSTGACILREWWENLCKCVGELSRCRRSRSSFREIRLHVDGGFEAPLVVHAKRVEFLEISRRRAQAINFFGALLPDRESGAFTIQKSP